MGFFDFFSMGFKRAGLLGTPVELASWNAPDQQLTAVQVVMSDLYGGDLSEFPMLRGEAQMIPAVRAALNTILSAAAALDFQAIDSATEEPTAKQPSWLKRADRGAQNPYLRLGRTIEDIFFSGYSLWRVDTRGYDGFALSCSHVSMQRWEWDESGLIKIDGQPVAKQDVIIIESLYPGILVVGSRTLRVAQDIERALRARAAVAIPMMTLTNTNDTELEQPEVQDLLKQYMQVRRSLSGAVAYVGLGMKLDVLEDNPDNWLLEARNASASDVAKLSGVPAGLLEASALSGSGANLNYTTELGQIARFQDFNLHQWLDPIEQRLSQDDVTPRGTEIKFNLSPLQSQSPAPINARPEPVAPTDAPEPEGVEILAPPATN